MMIHLFQLSHSPTYYGIQKMSYFRTFVPFLEQEVILQQDFFRIQEWQINTRKNKQHSAFRKCPTFEHLSHFGNSKHQVIEQDVAVTPLKMFIPLTHTRAILFVVSTLGASSVRGIDRSGQKSIAVISSYKRRYPENFKTIG